MTTTNLFSSTVQKLATAIALSICLISCGSNSPLGHESNQPESGGNLQITDIRFGTTEIEFSPDQIFVTGKVTNVSDQPVDQPFTLTLTAHDKDGLPIDSGSRIFSGIDPGQTLRFTILFKGDEHHVQQVNVAPSALRPVALSVPESANNSDFSRIALWSAEIQE